MIITTSAGYSLFYLLNLNTRVIKKRIAGLVRHLLSASMRTKIREWLDVSKKLVDRASIWKWERVSMPMAQDKPWKISYIGRKSNRKLARVCLGLEPYAEPIDEIRNEQEKIIISEFPFPGALKVPPYVRAVVPLDKPLEEIISRFDSELRRNLKKNRALYQTRKINSPDEVERIERQMLRPFAAARHGELAYQMPSEMVKRYALEFGRLDVVLKDGEEVACLLAAENVRSGKRYWLLDRFGYPESVFSDPKRLREVNAVNNHICMEWAIANGFDYYDIGLCFSQPDDGLLKWKRRRGARPELTGLKSQGYFYIGLPANRKPEFLWDYPLIAVEHGRLVLHLGLVSGQDDNAVLMRYREMGFDGIHKIYLYADQYPSITVVNGIRNLYDGFIWQPDVQVVH